MSFRNKIDFFVPASDGNVSASPVAVSAGIYTVGKNRVLRIVVGAADIFVRFGKDAADLSAIVTTANGMMLEANSVVYVSSSEFKFMKESAALDHVEFTTDRG